MTVEELLKPRYKVIADWPEMRDRFKGNPIIILNMNDGNDGPYTTNGYYLESFFTDYPHLFRKLEWWEERKPEEMPKYVKAIMGTNKGSYYKVADKSQNFRIWHVDGEIEFIHLQRFAHFFIPATEEEYLNQSATPIK